jgi:hypothetical protein
MKDIYPLGLGGQKIGVCDPITPPNQGSSMDKSFESFCRNVTEVCV